MFIEFEPLVASATASEMGGLDRQRREISIQVRRQRLGNELAKGQFNVLLSNWTNSF